MCIHVGAHFCAYLYEVCVYIQVDTFPCVFVCAHGLVYTCMCHFPVYLYGVCVHGCVYTCVCTLSSVGYVCMGVCIHVCACFPLYGVFVSVCIDVEIRG